MISPDLPITKSTEDTLNRNSFAGRLAQALLQYSFSSSFTIGLYGAWGSGKTSLLNMILENVASTDDSVVILRFNPWMCSDPKQLIMQFFKQLASAIKLKKPTTDHAWELINQYADIFDAVNAIPGIGTLLAAAGKSLATEAKKRIDIQTNDLQGRKDKIIQAMTEENLKIIVSIDDIDRLSEDEIIAVFQLVKALADFPNTIYLLAFDYDVVVRALGKVQHGDGREYLEKVIQVPFEIPAPSMASIHNALFSKLDTILSDIPEDNWDKVTWAELFQYGLKEYIRSIRDVIRYANVFSLKYELLKNETDPVDLLGLTCLQVFEPTIYSKLPKYKDTLCGANSSYSYEQQKADEEKTQRTIEELVPDNGITANVVAAKKILGILFPRTRSINGTSYILGRDYTHRNFLVHNNIAVSICFDRYFSLMLEDDAIPTVTIKHLIYQADEAELLEGITKLYQEGKIVRLLDEIEAHANKSVSSNISVGRAALIIKCLTRKWHCFKVDDRGFFSVPFAWRLLFCVDPLLESMEPPDRYPFVRSVFQDSDVQVSTLALVLHDLETQHGRFTDKAPRENETTITLEQVLELEQIFKCRAVEALDTGVALKQYGGLNFLWILAQIDAELVASRKSTMISDDSSLIKVISYCTSRGTIGGRMVSKTRQVNLKTLEEFIAVDTAYQRIQAFIMTNQFLSISEDEQMDALAFLLVMTREHSGGMMEHCILEETIQNELQKLLSMGS